MKHTYRHCERQRSSPAKNLDCRVGLRLLAMTMLCLLLSSCGFHPVYGVNKYQDVAVETHLALVDIENIPDREGQYLRNALIDRFYRGGRPLDPEYTLIVSPIEETLIDLDITKSADATRSQLRLESFFALKDRKTDEILLRRRLRTISSYNKLASEFATRVSEDSTRLNALDDLARQIEQQLALYFKRAD